MSTQESPLTPDEPETEPISVARLQAELDGTSPPDGPDVGVGELLAELDGSLFEDVFTFADDHVKASLDELLVLLVSLRESDTHGKQLLDDLAAEFDTSLSPGTVYPRLHSLCDAGVLEQRELVKTKEYTLADPADARAIVADAARQHLALGVAFYNALRDGDFE